MGSANRRVVITGLGAITPLGLDARSYWEGLCAGKSAVRAIPEYEACPSHIAATIPSFEPRSYLEKKDRKRLPVMVRTFQFAVACAKLALEDASLTVASIDSTRLATIFGSSTIPSELSDLGRAGQLCMSLPTHAEIERKWGAEGLAVIPPMWMLCHIPNMIGCHVSVIHDAQGPSNTITETDLGGLLAVGEGWRMIRQGRADVALAGSADTRMAPIAWVKQYHFSPLSKSQDPATACRPFDRGRDGIVLGEGGAVLILEELEHARRRQAKIYAEVTGFGSAFDRSVDRGIGRWPRGAPGDRSKLYPPRSGSNGLVRAIQAALAIGRIDPTDLDHINAQGYSTVADDAWEARSLSALAPAVDVFAVKSYIGTLGAGSGAVELAASLLAMRHGTLPATLNYEVPDPACPVRVNASPRPIERPNFVKVGFTELGQCAAIACRAWSD
jgi:3-oxoacyl-[acyl-carrier-protein] synthase II